MLQNLETTAAFMDIDTKITENLDKLRLGGVKSAINTFMPMLLNKNLDSIKVKNSLRLNQITDEISRDIDQIFKIISKSLNLSEKDRKTLLDTSSKEKQNVA